MDEESPTEEYGNKPTNILDYRLRLKRAQEYPLISDKERDQAREFGALLVSDMPLASPSGLLQTTEEVIGQTEDITEQLQTALFVGAAGELTKAVFGEVGILPAGNENQKEWGERFEGPGVNEIDYLKELLHDRKLVPNKAFFEGQNAVVDMVQILEYAASLKGKARDEYIDGLSHRKAVENLGISNEERFENKDLIVERTEKEKNTPLSKAKKFFK